jgi:hypothetical protein
MVILKATSFLEGHKRDMGMTFRITPEIRTHDPHTQLTHYPILLGVQPTSTVPHPTTLWNLVKMDDTIFREIKQKKKNEKSV